MRLRLFHQIFLLIAATALVAVVSMAGVMALNLKRGFADYLAARDAEELDLFVGVAARSIAANGGAAALRDGRVTLRSLLIETARAEGRPLPRFGPPPGTEEPIRAAGAQAPRPARPQGRPPRPPEDFGARLILKDPAGRLIAGPPGSANFPRDLGITRQVLVGGRTAALIQLMPRARAPSGVEARFLASQYQGAMILAALLVALAALPAWGLARLGARRLGRVRQATEAVAGGDFTMRLPEEGHDEIGDVARNINRMARSLGEVDTARRRWLAEVSHELRTPLASIRGELDALQDGLRPLDAAAVASLQEEALRLSALIEDLHFLSVSDLTASPCSFAPLDAEDLCARTIARFAAQAERAQIALAFDDWQWTGLPVRWDARRIEQLLANLLTNSLRYTDAGGRIVLALAEAEGMTRITVEDSPPGVPPEDLDALFAPLFRLDTTRRRADEGSGLGLAVCKAIAEAHGGRIAARPSTLGGIAIVIDLPLDAAA